MSERVASLKSQFEEALASVSDAESLEAVRVRFPVSYTHLTLPTN